MHNNKTEVISGSSTNEWYFHSVTFQILVCLSSYTVIISPLSYSPHDQVGLITILEGCKRLPFRCLARSFNSTLRRTEEHPISDSQSAC